MPVSKSTKSTPRKAEYNKMMNRDILTLSILVGGLFVIGMIMYNMQLLPFQEKSEAYVPPGVTAWATKVEGGTKVGTNQQGGIYKPAAGRANPAYGTGVSNFEPENPSDPNVANGKFVSMGYGGELVYSFGKVVNNVSGFDLTIHEATIGDRALSTEDVVMVEVSKDRSDWRKLGNASSRSNDGGQGIKKFDLASVGLDWIGYIKLRDISNRSLGKSYDDGFDLDAIGAVKLGTLSTPAPNSLGAAPAGANSTKTSCSMGSKTANQLNLVTYNVGDDSDVWKGGLAHDPERVARMAKLLMTDRNAEIIALHEIKHRVGDKQTMPPELAHVKTYFPAYSLFTRPHNESNDYSNVILSKYPFVSGSEKEHIMTGGSAVRKNLSVIINTPRGKVRVFAIHTRYGEQNPQTKQIAAWVKSVTTAEPGIPFVVMGDFNQSNSDNMKAFNDAKVSVVSPGLSGIDHIYLNNLSVKESCKVGNGGISGGHDPVFITTN